MGNVVKSLEILEQYSKLLLEQTNITADEMEYAINQLKDLEHYSLYTSGCWATDRPDLFANQIEAEKMFQLDFWEMHKHTGPRPKTFAPYVDETVEPVESYLVFCENHSPWTELEHNMIRVHSNAESHKLLNILEKHFAITNHHKG